MTRRLLPYIIFAALVLVLLWPLLSGGRVLLPGGMLSHFLPWSANASAAFDAHWDALTWDAAAYFYPARTLLGRALRSGELPLWNPYQMCGAPFLADAQSAVLYPPNWLFAVIPTGLAFGILAGLHLVAAGIFTYLFLRGTGLGRPASTFGGVAFMLSGFLVTWLELPVVLAAGVWLPLTLHLSRIAHERRSALYAGLTGVVLALSMLAGHPQIAIYVLLASALYWIWLGISGRKERRVLHSAGLAVFAFALAFGLAAPQLLPTIELAGLSHRGGTSATAQGYAAYSALAMPFRMLMVFLVPNFFGEPVHGTYWGVGQYAEYCGYLGIIPLLLAPLAFIRKGSRNRQGFFFLGLVVLALLMALGTGINRLFYFGVPGFAHSGSPARALFLYTFAMSILSALGLEKMLSQEPDALPLPSMDATGDSHIPPLPSMERSGTERERAGVRAYPPRPMGEGLRVRAGSNAVTLSLLPLLGLIIIFAILWYANVAFVERNAGLSGSDLWNTTWPEVFGFLLITIPSWGVLIAPLSGAFRASISGLAMIAVLAADLLTFGISYNPTAQRTEVYPSTRLTEFLDLNAGDARIMPFGQQWHLREFPEAVLPPNSAMVYRLFDVQGYDALYPLRYKKLLNAASGRDSSPPENGNMVFAFNPNSPVYDLLGVRWMISPMQEAGPSSGIDDCYVYENRDALPRAFVVRTLEYADDEEALRRISRGEVNMKKVAVIDPAEGRSLNPWRELASGQPAAADSARIARYSCNSVTVKVEAVGRGVLVLTDQFYPGWEARVDGKRAQMARVDYAFRGVAVPPGEHTVVFTYRPRSFRNGLVLALIAGLVVTVLAVRARKQQIAGSG